MLIVAAGGLLLPLVFRRPILAVYVLVGAAVTIEIFPLDFPDSLTDVIPFFLNLNNSAGLPVSITPAEILMAVALLAWLAGAAGGRQLHRPSSRLLRVYLTYLGVVLLAEVHGLLSGGDFNTSLWELRPQVYGFVLFLLSASLVRERREVLWVVGVFLAAAAFKALIGWYRVSVTLNGNAGDNILGHEDSYFLVLFLVATVAALIWVRRRKVVLALVLAAPVVAYVMLENRRRAASLALWAAMIVLLVIAVRYEADIRRKVVIGTAIAAICIGAFMATYWNAQYGLAAQVVRPIHTALGDQPTDERDLNSNIYRENENADLKATYGTSPLIGVGFGLPMLEIFPLADISQTYPFWQYIPHNSLLWIAMRMGLLGMAAFWGLIGTVLLEGVRQAGTHTDRVMRGVAAFAVAAIVAELVVGYGDLQLETYRNMIFVGAMAGVIDALSQLRPATQEKLAPRWAPVPLLRAGSHGRA